MLFHNNGFCLVFKWMGGFCVRWCVCVCVCVCGGGGF